MPDQSAQPRTIVRSLALPILAPVEPSNEWAALRADLNAMFDACRRAANLIVSEIYTRDMAALAQCEPGEFPPAKWSGVDRAAKAALPELPRQILSGVDHYVKQRYKGKNSNRQRVRIACMLGMQAVPNHTSVPIPCSPQKGDGGYKISATDQEILVNLPLMRRSNPNAKGQKRDRGIVTRWTVRLRTLDKTGKPRRQAMTLRRALAEGWKLGQLRLIESGREVMCAIAVHVPLEDLPDQRDGEFFVRTGDESLIEAFPPGADKPWVYNGDRLRQLIAMHRRWLARLRDDYKFRPRQRRTGTREVMERRALKANRAIDAELHRISAETVDKAQRCRCHTIKWDDSARGFLPVGGPYAKLKTMIESKAEAAQIAFISLTSEDGSAKTSTS